MGQSSSRQPSQPPQDRPTRRSSRARPLSRLFSDPTLPTANHPLNPRQSPRVDRLLLDPPPRRRRSDASPSRRSSRLARARNSIISTMPNRLSRHYESPRDQRSSSPSPSPPLSGNLSTQEDPESSGPRLPRVPPLPDMDIDFHRNSFSAESPPLTDPRRPPSRPMSSIADRISSLTPAREFSRLTASIRRRRSRRGPTEDNAAMLSRLLSVAAAATAASLMGGNPEAAVNDLRRAAVAVEPDDDSFDGFLQYLRSGRLASHLGQAGANAEPGSSNNGNPASLDFFRMFRFGSGSLSRGVSAGNTGAGTHTGGSTRPSSSPGRGSLAGDTANAEDAEGRMIPILIVGIRSLHAESDSGADAGDAMPSFLDALTNFPTTINVGLQDQAGGAVPRRPSRAMHMGQRRASMGAFFRRPGSTDTGRPNSEVGPSTAASTPPGPYPPPTTPSSAPLSALSSGATTPSRHPSMASSDNNERPASLVQDPTTSSRARRSSVLDPTAEEPGTISGTRRPRRLSESDFRHHGAGSPRRNGVVEPDNPPNGEGNRSWIIYVLGGNYPENHPILTTPSLFTDSPTYEDMLLLSNLLGPVKPPVANVDDVESAGGLFRIAEIDNMPTATAADGSDEIARIGPGENCLVCLSPYQVGEVARRLKSCGHLFHRECIDEWLTTGRNSCPLCRGLGVDEKSSAAGSQEGPVQVAPT